MKRIMIYLRGILVFLLTVFMGISLTTKAIAVEEEQEAAPESPQQAETMDGEEEEDPVEEDNSYIDSNETNVIMHPGESRQLTYWIGPEDTGELPSWYVTDSNCGMTVDSNGVVTAESKGEGYVTAYLSNGSSVNYYIRVIDYAESFSLGYDSFLIPLNSNTYVGIDIQPYSAQGCPVSVTSENEEIAFVSHVSPDTYFFINGVSEGTTKITVTVDNTITKTVDVTVKEGIAEYIFNEGNAYSKYIYTGEQLKLGYRLYPESAAEKPYWYVDNSSENYISVDQTGTVTGLAPGVGYVRAQIENGRSIQYTVNVADHAVSMKFAEEEMYIFKDPQNGENVREHLVFTPETAKYCELDLSSDDYSIARTESAYTSNVYGMNAGTTTIHALNKGDNLEASVKVTVVDGYASSIKASETDIYLNVDDTADLQYEISSYTGNLENEKVTFTVINGNEYAEVSDTGKVTAKAFGTAVVEARTAMYGKMTPEFFKNFVRYTIHVSAAPTGLHFVQDEYTIHVGNSGAIYAAADNPEAETCEREYTSSDPSILDVYSDGEIYARAEGTVTVTCKSGKSAEATTTVHVIPSVGRNYSYLDEDMFLTVNAGETRDAKEKLTVYGDQVIDYSVLEWISDDESIATVENGIVKGISAGYTMIHAKETDAGFNRANIQVFVGATVSEFGFTVSDYYLAVNETLNLRSLLAFKPADTIFTDITITSDNEEAVSVNKNYSLWEAKAVSEGTAVITVKKSTGEESELTIHVQDHAAPESLSVNGPLTVHVNHQRVPDIRIEPASADQNAYTLTSADPSIIKIDQNALYSLPCVTGVKAGTTQITATSTVDETKSVTFDMTVTEGDSDDYQYFVSLHEITTDFSYIKSYGNHDEYTVYVGRSYSISAGRLSTNVRTFETPVIVSPFLNVDTDENNSIARLGAGYGWVSGPSSFTQSSKTGPFVCLREGTVVFKTYGSRTLTLHVVNSPEEDLEVLADDITQAEDPTETVTFTEEPETVKEKIEEAVSNGETLVVELNEEIIENVDEQEMDLILEAVSDENAAMDCYDLSLVLKTSESDEVISEITETNRPITVRLPLSEEAKAAGGGYKVIRVHEGEAEELECSVSEDGDQIIFKTDKFSTYAIVYEKPEEIINLTGSTLELAGKIGVTFYMDIPEERLDDLTVILKFNDEEISIPAKNGNPKDTEGGKLMGYQQRIFAKEMRDVITVKVVDSDGKNIALKNEEGIFREGYSFAAVTYYAKAEQKGSEKLKVLTRAMNNYGKFAQQYLNYKIDDEVKNTADVSDVTLENLKEYEAVISETEVEGLTYKGGTTMMEAAVGYRLYFALDGGHSINEYKFTIDGKEVQPKQSGNNYFIEKPNIEARALGVKNTIEVTDGKTTKSIEYCALSYAYKALTLTDPGKALLQDLCRSIYIYNQKAIDYFK